MPINSAKYENMPTKKKSDSDNNFESNYIDDYFLAAKCRIIGENVRSERKKRKFSIENLADYIELSASYVGLIERGERCPSLKSILKLCELFQVDPNTLILEQISKNRPEVVTQVEIREEKRRNSYDAIIALLQGLNETELDCIAETIKGIRKMLRKNEIDSPPVAAKIPGKRGITKKPI